jgi:farnesyl-diphosphate farnesyltransferase
MLGNKIGQVNTDSGKDLDRALQFTKEILPCVSRTFDLAIKFLPRRLGRPVGLAYLLCRIADTYEDSSILSPGLKRARLIEYADLLENPDFNNRTLIGELESAFPNSSGDPQGEMVDARDPNHTLVNNIGQVLLAVDSMPASFKRHIFPRVREMALGMAHYTASDAGLIDPSVSRSNVVFLKDEEDWDRYCYYVAGTVGHMLTDIFSDYAGFSDDTRHHLHKLGCSFGLGLQKVNVLKDAVVDARRGICFLPGTLIEQYGIHFDDNSQADICGDTAGLVRKIIEICRGHFQDALEYIKVIPVKYFGLRMFLIVPVMLAAGTLRLFSEYPQRLFEKGDFKLPRNEVWSLIRRSSFCKYSNRLLLSAFNQIYPA